MSRTRRLAGRFSTMFGIYAAARESASAVEAGRQPAAESLRALGIDAEHFSRIGR